jgi:hypothetical protein
MRRSVIMVMIAMLAVIGIAAVIGNMSQGINTSLTSATKKSANSPSTTMPLNMRAFLRSEQPAQYPPGVNPHKLQQETIKKLAPQMAKKMEQLSKLPPPQLPVPGVYSGRGVYNSIGFSQSTFQVTKSWFIGHLPALGNRWIQIFAGAQTVDVGTLTFQTGRGGIVLQRFYDGQPRPQCHTLCGFQMYLSSVNSPLKIISVVGNTVNLVSESGVKLTFNVATMSYSYN